MERQPPQVLKFRVDFTGFGEGLYQLTGPTLPGWEWTLPGQESTLAGSESVLASLLLFTKNLFLMESQKSWYLVFPAGSDYGES